MDGEITLTQILNNMRGSADEIATDIYKYANSKITNISNIKKIHILYLVAKYILIDLNKKISEVLNEDVSSSLDKAENQGKNIQEIIEFDNAHKIRYCFTNLDFNIKSLTQSKENIINKLSSSVNLLRKKWGDSNEKDSKQKQSYVEACGSLCSSLVINKPTTAPIHQKIKNAISINSDGLTFNVLTKNGASSEQYLFKVFDDDGIQCIQVGDETVFVGPYDIIDGKNGDQSISRYCRRHSKDRACVYSNCQYFHSPCINKKNSNARRRFMSFRFGELSRFINNYSNAGHWDRHQRMDIGRDLIQAGWINIIRGYKLLKN